VVRVELAGLRSVRAALLHRALIVGGTPSIDLSELGFDPDSGLPRRVVVHAETTTKYGSLAVRYVFNLGFVPVSSAVTPLVDP
jgi:hypothetical protein